MRRIIYTSLVQIIFLGACSTPPQANTETQKATDFDTSTLIIKSNPYKLLRGQLVYLPVYSNIPAHIDSSEYHFDMSAFVAIHNTDLKNKIVISKVLYFNTEGKLVHDFLNGELVELPPLATIYYYIPQKDKSGIGANFLIEWTSEEPTNEPLLESVTINLHTSNSAAIMSQGRVIRELR